MLRHSRATMGWVGMAFNSGKAYPIVDDFLLELFVVCWCAGSVESRGLCQYISLARSGGSLRIHTAQMFCLRNGVRTRREKLKAEGIFNLLCVRILAGCAKPVSIKRAKVTLSSHEGIEKRSRAHCCLQGQLK